MSHTLTANGLPVLTGESEGSSGDAGAAAASMFERQSLAAARNMRGEKTTCTVFYLLIGEYAVGNTFPTDYRGLREWMENTFRVEMVVFGLTVSDLFEPWCPIKVGFAREMPDGKIAFGGNSPDLMKRAHRGIILHNLANGPRAQGDATDVDTLEVL